MKCRSPALTVTRSVITCHIDPEDFLGIPLPSFFKSFSFDFIRRSHAKSITGTQSGRGTQNIRSKDDSLQVSSIHYFSFLAFGLISFILGMDAI
jgi:hypothetical protein